MNLKRCLAKARSVVDPAEDIELSEDLDLIEASAAEYIAGGMDAQAAAIQAVQDAINQASEDHQELLGRIRDQIPEPEAAPEPEPVETGPDTAPEPKGDVNTVRRDIAARIFNEVITPEPTATISLRSDFDSQAYQDIQVWLDTNREELQATDLGLEAYSQLTIGTGSLDREMFDAEYMDALFKETTRRAKVAAKKEQVALFKSDIKRSIKDGYFVRFPDDIENGVTVDQYKIYRAGFMHRLEGGTLSNIPKVSDAGVQRMGYDDATKWLKTDIGKKFAAGVKVKKGKRSTGVVLKRVMDMSTKGGTNKLVDRLIAATARTEVFDIATMLPEDAEPSALAMLESIRKELPTLTEWAGGLEGGSRSRYYVGYKEALYNAAESTKVDDADYGVNKVKKYAESYTKAITDLSNAINTAQARNVTQIAEAMNGWFNGIGKQFDEPFYDALKERYDGRHPLNLDAVRRIFDRQLYQLERGDYIRDENNYLRAPYSTTQSPSRQMRYFRDQWSESDTPERKVIRRPRLDGIDRTGFEDSRKNENASIDRIKTEFGFENVQRGEGYNASRMQDHLNYGFDAFEDLAALLGIDKKHIGLGGEMYMAFGALGHGRHAAHFSPNHPLPEGGGSVPVINLTATTGDGSLAHEYMHALDFMLRADDGERVSRSNEKKPMVLPNYGPIREVIEMLRTMPHTRAEIDAVIEEQKGYWGDDQKALARNLRRRLEGMGSDLRYNVEHKRTGRWYGNRTHYHRASINLGEDYWGNATEMFARAGESYIFDIMDDSDRRQDYLVTDWVADGTVTKDRGYRGSPYPEGEERLFFKEVFKVLFEKALKFTDNGVEAVEDFSIMEHFTRPQLEYIEEQVGKLPTPEEIKEAEEESEEARIKALRDQLTGAGTPPSPLGTGPARPEQTGVALDIDEIEEDTPYEKDPNSWDDDDITAILEEAMTRNEESTQEPERPETPAPEPAKDKRTSADVAKELFGNTSDAVEGALDGLASLFGVDDGTKLRSGFPGDFNKETYEKAKPHFQVAWTAAKAAAGNVKELMHIFLDQMTAAFSAGIRPYLMEWIKEHRAEIASFARDKGKELTQQPETQTPLIKAMVEAIEAGTLPANNNALRKFAADILGTEIDNAALKGVQEDLEAAQAIAARNLIRKGGDDKAIFDALVARYEAQPNLNIRTSTSIANQAYSTPVPLAFMVDRIARTSGARVYEPSAGNGALLIDTSPDNVVANELDPVRAKNLQRQGFTTIQSDAVTAVPEGRVAPASADAVVTNPPFGKAEQTVTVQGYRLDKIDHIVAARSLLAMKSDGRATLILAADKVNPGAMTGSDRVFYNWLYSNYNVVGNFEVAGKLYSRQGAAWPVRVITVAGREQTKSVAPATLPAVRVDSWEGVYEQAKQSESSAAVVQSNVTDRDFIEGISGSPDLQTTPDGTGLSTEPGVETGPTGGGGTPGSRTGGGGRAGPGGSSGGRDGGRSGAGTNADGSGQRGDREGGLAGEQEPAGTGDRPQTRNPDTEGRIGRDEGDLAESFQADYVGITPDDGAMGRVLTPTNMRDAIHAALKSIEADVGDIPTYVQKKLGYATMADLKAAMMPLQIDTTAAAIYNIEHGTGVIIADQTGIGKGRQAAGILRYAKQQGKIPVFMTEKADLFSDMHRDLTGIGSGDMVPLIINGDGRVIVQDEAGEDTVLHRSPKNVREIVSEMIGSGKPPSEYDMVFLTYSQLPGHYDTMVAKRDMLNAIAPNAIFVLDESHTAAGNDSSTGEIMRPIVAEAAGVTYLSATYSKRANTMGLYFRTVLGKMVDSVEDLVEIMQSGGDQLQAILSNTLSRAGQLFRRERSYDGIDTNVLRDVDNREEHRKQADEATRALRAITLASTQLANSKKGWTGWLTDQGYTTIGSGNKIQETVTLTHFASVSHNMIRQILLGLKADGAADMAIAALKRGEKPVIGTENTMGTFLNDYRVLTDTKDGEVLRNFDYRAVLSKALVNTRNIKIKTEQGVETWVVLPLDALPREVAIAYQEAARVIEQANLNIPVSPLDWMMTKIRKAGFSVQEITGRDWKVDYADPDRPILGSRKAQDKNKVRIRNMFNSGETDALVVNVSGATGISLHSSVDFRDQRKRRMIIAQPMQDINKYMQLLGRINRTGQVSSLEEASDNNAVDKGKPATYGLPEYDIMTLDIPAEIRPTSVLMRKMRSLNANVSSNTESEGSLDSLDLLNKYGDQVVFELLKEDPSFFQELGGLAGSDSTQDKAPDGFAQDVTGKLAMLPVARQEAFYDEIAPRYESLIDYLNSVGQNDLTIDIKDFRAKPIPGQEPDIIYNTPEEIAYIVPDAFMQKWEVKKLAFPPTAQEVEAKIENESGGVSAEAYTESILIAKEEADKAHKDHLNDQMSVLQAEANREETTDDRRIAISSRIMTLRESLEDFEKAAGRFRKKLNRDYQIGRMMNVDLGGGLMTGVIVRIKDSSKPNGTDPYADSKTEITFMVNGDLRTFKMPISALERRDVIQGRAYADLATAFSAERSSSTTEERWLITGNVMGGLSRLADDQKKEIAYFTMEDGEVVPGVVMPLSFNPENAGIKRDIAMRYPMAVAEFLRDYATDMDVSRFGVAANDNSMRIVPVSSSSFRIRVPKSKKEGGKWHQNKRLLDITGDFVQASTNFMDVTVSFDQLVNATGIILESTSLYAPESQAEKAKPYVDRHGQSPKHSRIGPTNAPRPVKDVRQEVYDLLKADHALVKSGRLRVVQSESELPGHLQHELGGVKGVVDPLNGNIFIVADNVGGNVKGVVMHELGVHVGLKKLLGNKYEEVIRQLRGLRAVKKAEAVDAYAQVPSDTRPDYVDEEALAYLVENEAARETNIVKKIIAAVRAWMFRNGILVRELSPADMLAMAAAAARAAGREKLVAEPLTVDEQVSPAYSQSETSPHYSRVETVKATIDRLRRKKEAPRSDYFRENEAIRERDKPFWDKVKTELKRQLSPGGLLPNVAFQLKIWRDSQFEVGELDIRNIVAHFDAAIKKAYGKDLDELDAALVVRINRLLSVPIDRFRDAAEGLPDEVVDQVAVMRKFIKRYSVDIADIIANDIDELQAKGNDARAAAKTDLLNTITDRLGHYVNRSYQVYEDEKWPTNVPDAVLDNARSYLEEEAEKQAEEYDHFAFKARQKGDEALAARHEERAEKLRDPLRPRRIMEEILKSGTAFDTFQGYIKESKLGAKDLTILMKRKDIAPEIRALMGEYQDPRLNFAKTATKQNRLIFNSRFLDKIVEIGLGDFLWAKDDPNRPPEAYKQIAGLAEAYAPLGGYYVTAETEKAFRDALGPEDNGGKFMRQVIKYNGLVKFGKTVLSPTTGARNWISASFFALANGHFDFKQMRRSWKSAKSYFNHKGDAVAYLRRLKELGVVYDTPYAGEMMRLMKESQIEDWEFLGKRKMLRHGIDMATKAYQFGDDFWKILGFENEVALLMKHKKMDRGAAEIAAAERIRNTYPTYSMTGRFINELRRFPLAGTFVSFPSEIIRTSYNMMRYLKEDMADPDLRPLALRRGAGLAIASGFAYAAQAVAMAIAGVDDDEEEAFRDLAAPWQRNSNIIPLPGRDANGNLQFVDMSFLDPYNYFKRPINAILRDQPAEDMMVEIAREVLTPFFGTDIAAGAIMEIFMNKRETGGRVYNPQDQVPTQVVDMTDHLWKNLQPGVMSNVSRMMNAMQGKVSPSGKRYEMTDEAWALIGVRISTHDPRAAIYYKSFEFRDKKRDATSILTAVARDLNEVSDKSLKHAYERSMVVRTRAYTEMTRLVNAAKASGMPEYRLRQILSQSGVSKADVQALLVGAVPAYRPSKGYLKQAVNKAKILYPQRAAEIEARRKLLTDLPKPGS